MSIMQDLPLDLLHDVASHLSLVDAMQFESTCKAFRDIVKPRITRWKQVLTDHKIEKWKTDPSTAYPWHDNRDEHVYVKTVEWASPNFQKDDALKCFNKKHIEGTDCYYIHIWVTSTKSDVDETIRKLKLWVSAQCSAVLCLFVACGVDENGHGSEGVRCNLHNEHLQPFINARHFTICECDYITDDAIIQFTNLDWLKVYESASLTGICVDKLISKHKLHTVSWFFTQSSIPHAIIPTLSDVLCLYLCNGKLKRLDMGLMDPHMIKRLKFGNQ